MLLNLLPILNGAKQRIEQTERMEFLDFELVDGNCPLTEPVVVQLTVENDSEGVLFTAHVNTNLHTSCARCATPITKPLQFEFSSLIVKKLAEGQDEDEVVVLEGTELDIAELVLNNIILNLDMRYLCDEDCKGMCVQCGANLNEQDCKCKKDRTDPRLEVLRALLKD